MTHPPSILTQYLKDMTTKRPMYYLIITDAMVRLRSYSNFLGPAETGINGFGLGMAGFKKRISTLLLK